MEGVDTQFDGEFLSRLPVLSTNVLRFLPAVDLQEASRVCSSWYHLAKEEQAKRTQICWSVYDKVNVKTQGFRRMISKDVQELFIDPGMAIALGNFNFPSWITNEHEQTAAGTSSSNCSNNPFPPLCQVLGAWSSGITLPSSDSTTKSQEIEYKEDRMKNMDAFSVLFIPRSIVIEAGIHRFVAPYNHFSSAITNLPDDEFFASLGLPSSVDPKLIILLADGQGYPSASVFRKLRRKGKTLVMGALVDNVVPSCTTCDDADGENVMLGIVFCGDSVQCRSVVLGRDVKTSHDAVKRIKRLNTGDVRQENRVAFQMSCVARGRRHYRADSVESAAFQSVFPRVPLFGLFGYGEFGENFPPDETCSGDQGQKAPKRRKDTEPNMKLSFTSVISLVSLSR